MHWLDLCLSTGPLNYQDKGWREAFLLEWSGCVDNFLITISKSLDWGQKLESLLAWMDFSKLCQWLAWTLLLPMYWSTSVTYRDLLLVSFSLQSLGPSTQLYILLTSQQAIQNNIDWMFVMTEVVLPSVIRHWSQWGIIKHHERDLCS